MNDSEQTELEKMFELDEAIRFNHNIPTGSYSLKVNPEEELEKYRLGMARLTLPHRFGMYRKQAKNTPKVTSVDMEVPSENPPAEPTTANPDHKVRPIFPLDD